MLVQKNDIDGNFARVLIGVFIFSAGFIVNLQSDSILRNLRKPGETGYKIPRGNCGVEWKH